MAVEVEEALLIRLMSGEGETCSWRVRRGELSTLLAVGVPEEMLKEIEWRCVSGEVKSVIFLRQKIDGVDYRAVVERIGVRRSLAVFGAGHVGRSVALVGAMLGMEVYLIDDREDFLGEDAVPVACVEKVRVSFEEIGNLALLNETSAAVIVTRGHQYDEVILRHLAGYKIPYVGMIGSRRRVGSILRRLIREGVDESFLSGVKAPIGLGIGAVSPQEIAVAIHAEIIQCFNGGAASDNIHSLSMKEQNCVKAG